MLKNLSTTFKLILMVALPIVALLYFAYSGVTDKYRMSNNADAIRSLSALALRAGALVHELQKERGMTAGFLGSKGKKFASEIITQRGNTDRQLSELRTFLAEFDRELLVDGGGYLQLAMGYFTDLSAKRNAINSLRIALGDAIGFYTAINTEFLRLIRHMSRLSFDDEIAGMLTAYANFLQAKERSGIERAVLNNVFSANRVTMVLYHRFVDLISAQKLYLESFLAYANPEQRGFYERKMSHSSVAEVAGMEAVARGAQQKSETTSGLLQFFGYGGAIHLFKNYVLRGQEKYVDRFNERYAAAAKILDRFNNLSALSEADRKDIAAVRSTLEAYRDAFPLVGKLREEGLSVAEIDARVKIDDGPAIRALGRLAKGGEMGVEAEHWFRTMTVKINLLKEVEDKLVGDIVGKADQVRQSAQYSLTLFLVVALLAGVLSVLFSLLVTRNILNQLGGEPAFIAGIAEKVAGGDLNIQFDSSGNIVGIHASMKKMVEGLRNIEQEKREQQQALDETVRMLRESDVLKTGQAELNDAMRGALDIHTLSRNVITHLAKFCGAQIGALYLSDEDGLFDKRGTLRLAGSYAFTKRKHLNASIAVGEGLVGQAALERETISVTDIPEDYIRVSSSFGDSTPRDILVSPFAYEDELAGVIELGAFKEFPDSTLEFLKTVMEPIAIAVSTASARTRMQTLLEETQAQAEELQTQQEELRAANEELEEKTEILEKNEQQLKEQQEELRVTNEELEEKTNALEEKTNEIQRRNEDLEQTRLDLEKQAEALETSGKYKSDFLANMSHELRTPLNSLLILSQSLSENKEGNLNEEQTEAASIIHESGQDLLNLINEILDLSKIEAGQMNIEIEEVPFMEIARNLEAGFQPAAQEKGISFAVKVAPQLPASLRTDRMRIRQLLKNLISNALKFTEKGGVTVHFYPPAPEEIPRHEHLRPGKTVAFAVTDTGIGIAEEKQRIVFEAFQQAEGGTARQYGGTGLGLSISRDLSRLLRGTVTLKSEEHKGSTFTLYLPLDCEQADAKTSEAPLAEGGTQLQTSLSPVPAKPLVHPPPVDDDRELIEAGDRVMLIVEDDPHFAKILLKQGREHDFRGLVAGTGEEGLELAEKYKPDAIVLDLHLPGMIGWRVLDTLKENPHLRHIPVHIMSSDETNIDAFKKGAIGFLTKPVGKEQLKQAFSDIETFIETSIKELLIVEDKKKSRKALSRLIGNSDIRIHEAATGKDALEKIQTHTFHCVVLDLGLPDMSGLDLLRKLHREDVPIPPIVVHTGRQLTREEEEELRKYTESIVIKGTKSPERLLNETSLFLHRMVERLPEKQRRMVTQLLDKDALFAGKKILLVDDDMRNLFSLSKVMNERGMMVQKAENGEKALEELNKNPDINLVLMDIMMPVMDGYEAMQKIREQDRFLELPILALTAKAMKGDREKCIAAGANDYLTKPVDLERLFSMLRVWLYQ